MTNNLRTRIAKAIADAQFAFDQGDPYNGPEDADVLADAVIRELEANCIYRYACAHCGDFWFDKSERMQRFALLHGKAHADDR